MNRAPSKAESANAPLTPARVPEVQGQLDGLADAIDSLDLAVSILLSRTESISREREDKNDCREQPYCSTPMGRVVQHLRNRVSNVAEILESLADRIEV